MFEHSVKVPRHFKVVANIVKKVSTEGGSVKTLLYDDKLRHFKTNVLYALITETIKHAAYIDKIFAHCQLFQTENRLDPWLAKVLTTELLFGKKTLPSQSKPEQTILSYKEQFENYVSEHQDLKNEAAPRPRYVRINTNLLTTSDAIRAFQDEGYHFIRCTSGSYEDYLQQIQKLTEFDFTQDYHIKTIFVFAPGTKWHDHELYLENKVILQDKATAMAVHLLAPPSGSVCLDMCAAPGMKTTQLAAYLRNEGKIYAVERDDKRYQTLCDFVEKTGSKCVTTLHRDSLEIKRGDHDEVEYILLDPSCSGSGMDFCVHNYIEESRLAKLTSLQEKFLKHAMNAFPKAKRIIYSTCSLYPEENERVVTNVVKTSRAKWRVRDVKDLLKGQWLNFGSGMYGSMGARCMYAKPETDFTTGFFLAVLDRDEKDLAKVYRQEDISDGKVETAVEEGNDMERNKRRKVKNDEIEVDGQVKKKKKNKVESPKENDVTTIEEGNDMNVERNKRRKVENDTEIEVESEVKKKKKNKVESFEENGVTTVLDSNDMEVEGNKMRKVKNDTEIEVDGHVKKKKKHKVESPEENNGTTVEDSNDMEVKRNKMKKVKNDTEIEVESEVKNKKKNKVQSHEETNVTTVEDSNDMEVERNKKRKVKNDTEIDVDGEVKKKKKHKVEPLVENNVELEVPKKKKRKVEEVCDGLADLSVEESEAPKKKKKKEKVRYEDVEMIENFQEVTEEERKSKKKKKKEIK